MRFSVIIPVYNDPDGLSQTISSLQDISYAGKYEIIIVDNGSSDNTPNIAADFANRESNVRFAVEKQIQSSYAARNRGITLSKGEILVFLDADMTVDDDWLQQLDEFYHNKEACYVGCDVEIYQPINKNTLFGQYNVAEGFPINMYIKKMNFAPTCCLSVKREVIEDVGKFLRSVISGGDKEFGNRVAASGYSQHFAKNIKLYHPARISIWEHISKAERVGRGREQLYQLSSTHRGRPWYHPRNFVPPHPGRFLYRMPPNLNLRHYFAFYTISYMLKLVKVNGQIKQWLL